MKTKTLRRLGIFLLILSVLSVFGMIGFYFANYIMMQEGYYSWGEPLMISMTICGMLHFVGYLGIPLLIIASNKEELEKKLRGEVSRPMMTPQPIPALQNEFKYCACCGQKNKMDSKFCMQCGNKLP